MFWMIDFERFGMVVIFLNRLKWVGVGGCLDPYSDSYLKQLVTWEDEQFQVVFSLSAEHWKFFFQTNEWREELLTSQPLPMCPDVLLLPWQLIHFWHDLDIELLVPSLPLQWWIPVLVTLSMCPFDEAFLFNYRLYLCYLEIWFDNFNVLFYIIMSWRAWLAICFQGGASCSFHRLDILLSNPQSIMSWWLGVMAFYPRKFPMKRSIMLKPSLNL